MNARVTVTAITMSIVSLAITFDLGYTALKYINKCKKLENELKQYKEKESTEASN